MALIAKTQFGLRRTFLELLDELVQVGELAGDLAVVAHFFLVGRGDGDGDGIFVDVQAEVVDDFFHGCLVG